MAIEPRLNDNGTLNLSKLPDTQIVAGLLATRVKMFNEAAQLRERTDGIKKDIAAIDRVLDAVGYSGELDAIMPRRAPLRVFEQGELTRLTLEVLRRSGPLTAGSIAFAHLVARGEDTEDRKALKAMTDRVSRFLRRERSKGRVVAQNGEGKALLWSIKPPRVASNQPTNAIPEP